MNLRNSSLVIPEYSVPPSSPSPNAAWIQVTGLTGSAGAAMGVMGLTYTSPVFSSAELNYRTEQNKTVKVPLS